MELSEYLYNIWKNNEFAQSWIIKGTNTKVHREILAFISMINEGQDNIFSLSNPDVKVIELNHSKGGEAQRAITVNQIRELQDFLRLTSGFSPHKFVIITSAELMNLNAANCCLKILEDIPANNYIFLISLLPETLLATIRSRCFYLSLPSLDKNECINTKALDIASDFLNPQVKISEKLGLIEQLSDGGGTLSFKEFKDAILHVLQLTIYTTIGYNSKGDINYGQGKQLSQFNRAVRETRITPLKIITISDRIRKLLLSCEEDNLDIKQVLVVIVTYIILAFENE